MHKNRNLAFHLYMALFLAYLLIPLIIMGGAAFNDSRFPSILPWRGFTTQWFTDLGADGRMWIAFRNTVIVALAVVVIAVPVGTAAAILVKNSARAMPAGGREMSASAPWAAACLARRREVSMSSACS